MEGRQRTMSNEMQVNGVHILDTFNDFVAGEFYVNRKYQRKLVWTLEEKQAFIDTILHKYPVPIFLIVKYKTAEEDFYHKEIIDGLQRFNAIFSFIKGEFAVKDVDGTYKYFNPEAMAGFSEWLKDGTLSMHDSVFTYQVSRDFLNYQLPVTTTEVGDSEVEEIFMRINATGRKLSKQDLRQVGTVGLFSDLVRRTACYIRGDITESDIVKLEKMPELSLDNVGLPYSISVKDSFWVSNGILTESNIRISRDEELIAWIYIYILQGREVSPSAATLDKVYDSNSDLSQEVNSRIKDESTLFELMDKFAKTIADFNKILKSVGMTFDELLFGRGKIHNKAKVFQVMFLAIYNLREEGYVIKNYKGVAKELNGLGLEGEVRRVTEDREWNKEVRDDVIKKFIRVLKPLTEEGEINRANKEWKLKLETQLLRAAGAEKQMYDFKIGITTLQTGKPNSECISKIIKTLTAMANTDPRKEGLVIIGIADNEQASKEYENHYGNMSLKVNGYYITGVDSEINKYYHGSTDEYQKYITQVIENEPITDDVKSQILRTMNIVVYEGKTLVILKCKSCGHAAVYKREYYERHGSSTELVQIGSTAFNSLMRRTMDVETSQSNSVVDELSKLQADLYKV